MDSKTTRRPPIADTAGMSFENFYRTEYGHMVAVARALVRDAAAAEDLAQDSFIAAHRNWEKVSGYEAPQAWVRRVLINRAASRHRRLGAEVRALVRLGEEGHSEMPDLSSPTSEVWEQVRRLPRRQRDAVVLHYVGQLTMEEIGETMGCSPGAVKSHLHRARETLGRRLSDWNEV